MTTLPYIIRNSDLAKLAFTHPSKTKSEKLLSYERLEFLGDKVVNLIAAKLIYTTFHDQDEGKLSKVLSILISTKSLANIARSINLGRYLIINPADDIDNLRETDKLLENLLESYIGASFLELGFEEAEKIFTPLFNQAISKINLLDVNDPKSMLQEIIQTQYKILPIYKTISDVGLPHKKIFTVELTIPNGDSVTGCGSSIKSAQREAAKNMLQKLKWSSS
jgi:ribonuclease III